jgi:hypothetical protein
MFHCRQLQLSVRAIGNGRIHKLLIAGVGLTWGTLHGVPRASSGMTQRQQTCLKSLTHIYDLAPNQTTRGNLKSAFSKADLCFAFPVTLIRLTPCGTGAIIQAAPHSHWTSFVPFHHQEITSLHHLYAFSLFHAMLMCWVCTLISQPRLNSVVYI